MIAGLTHSDLRYMQQLFSREPSIEQVWLYGSRAKGSYQPGSDVDLALVGAAINRHIVTRIHTILEDESPVPYFFDVVNWNSLNNAKVKDEIQRTAQLLYQQ